MNYRAITEGRKRIKAQKQEAVARDFQRLWATLTEAEKAEARAAAEAKIAHRKAD
jgi:hypothetical protein